MVYSAICPRYSRRLLALPSRRSPTFGAVPPLREGDLSCCRRSLHPATLFPRPYKISPSPNPILIPSVFSEFSANLPFPFSHQGLWEFFILAKESICPISLLWHMHFTCIPLFLYLTTLCSLCVSLPGLSFSLLPRTLYALHFIFFFFISLPGSQLLPMLRRLDLFSLFWS